MNQNDSNSSQRQERKERRRLLVAVMDGMFRSWQCVVYWSLGACGHLITNQRKSLILVYHCIIGCLLTNEQPLHKQLSTISK